MLPAIRARSPLRAPLACALAAAALVGLAVGRAPPGDRSSNIRFVGNATTPAASLRAALADDLPFDDAGHVDREILDRDRLLLTAYYMDRGRPLAEIGDPVIASGGDAVTIPIDEGRLFSISAVRFTGNAAGRAAEAARGRVRVRPGALFSRSQIAADCDALTSLYQDQGYAFALVMVFTDLDVERGAIALTFEVSLGARASFERIEVAGEPGMTSRARDALGFAEGDRFSAAALDRAKRGLAALGFANAVLSTERGSSDDQVVVRVQLSDGA